MAIYGATSNCSTRPFNRLSALLVWVSLRLTHCLFFYLRYVWVQQLQQQQQTNWAKIGSEWLRIVIILVRVNPNVFLGELEREGTCINRQCEEIRLVSRSCFLFFSAINFLTELGKNNNRNYRERRTSSVCLRLKGRRSKETSPSLEGSSSLARCREEADDFHVISVPKQNKQSGD